MLILFLILAYSVFSALGMVLIKKGSKKSNIIKSKNGLLLNLDYVFFIGVLLYILSFALWISLLQIFPIVYISPIGYGFNFIFTAFFAFLFLKEKVKFTEILGVITIIIGVIFVSIKL